MPNSARVFTERSILPNTSLAYILRFYEDGQAVKISILAWRIEWTRDHRFDGSDCDISNPWPITLGDDYDSLVGVVDFIVDQGQYIATCDIEFSSEDEALAYAKQRLTAVA